ncbi:MAG: T9SS type A sorting domain-containing protein [Paludibacter sp.]|nr:T9SS type A sorting domain-containing protein [Paludibacter sp.]
MKHLQKPTFYYFLLLLLSFSIQGICQSNVVSYSYDNAGNRISRRVVVYSTNLTHAKKIVDPAPVEEQLGERSIKVFPNPTKGALAVEITGGSDKDPLRIILYNADGKQLLNKQVQQGTTPVNMAGYPAAYYILRVEAGEKVTEFKIIKQ